MNKLYEKSGVANPQEIKEAYIFAKENGYTHISCKGSNGYYGWDSKNNTHKPMDSSGRQCQELATDNIVLIVSVDFKTVEQPASEQTNYVSILSLTENKQLEDTSESIKTAQEPNYKELYLFAVKSSEEQTLKITELEKALENSNAERDMFVNLDKDNKVKIAELEKCLDDERSAIIAIGNKVLTLDEYMNKKVSLPYGTTMEIEVKKTLESTETLESEE